MRSIPTVGLLFLAAACNDPIAPPEAALVVTPDQAAVSQDGQSMTIPFTLTNRSSAQVFVSACGDQARVVIEHTTGSAWETYAGGFCLAVLPTTPLPLAAGNTLAGTVSVPGTSGSYRLRARFSVDAGGPEIVGAPSAPVDVP